MVPTIFIKYQSSFLQEKFHILDIKNNKEFLIYENRLSK